MTDTSRFRKLPLELRKEIYTYLIVENQAIRIQRALPSNKAIESTCNHASGRKCKERKCCRPKDGTRLAMLQVNESFGEEAKQVTYGCNSFEFVNSGALRCFLMQIGDGSNFLRHVAVLDRGLVFANSWKALDNSVGILAQAKSLRTLKVSHVAFCAVKEPVVLVEELAEHCRPLLRALDDEFMAKRLSTSVFDTLDIVLGSCYNEFGSDFWNCRSDRGGPTGAHPRFHFFGSAKPGTYLRTGTCKCLCGEAEEANNKLKQELKEEVAKQLG